MYYIGVDLGGTKILTAIANREGEILARKKISTEADKGQDVIIGNIIQSVNTVIEEAGVDKNDVECLGIGSPGPINSKEGIIYESPNLSMGKVHIVDLLEERTGFNVKLENDANAAALGEKWFGAGEDVDHMIYITVSTGIGGGIIIEKKLLQGCEGAGGEIGHITLEPDGPVCGCGNHGCLEALASGTAIARMGRESMRKNPDGLIAQMAEKDPEKVDALLVARAAQKGDAEAISIYNKAGTYLGIGLAALINIFNTEMIVFGGGVMRDRDLLNDAMMASVEKRTMPSSLEKVEIKTSALKSDTGVYGALAVAMEKELIS